MPYGRSKAATQRSKFKCPSGVQGSRSKNKNRHRSCHRDSGGVDDGKFLIRLLIKHGTIRRPKGFCKVLFALRGSELDFLSPFEKHSLLLHLTDESP